MTREDGAVRSPSKSSSALLRNCDLSPGEPTMRRAYVACSGQRRFAFLVLAAAGDSFPRWEAFRGEVPMQAFVSLAVHRSVGVW